MALNYSAGTACPEKSSQGEPLPPAAPPSSPAAAISPGHSHRLADGDSCYLVTMGLCAHVRAKNAQAAAAVAADAAVGAATESAPSDTAKIGSLYISSIPAQQHPQHFEYHHEQHTHQLQLSPCSPRLGTPLSGQHPYQQQQQQPPSFCTIHVDNGVAYGADCAATEAVIGAVARAAAAEVSLAAASSDESSLCGELPAGPSGASRGGKPGVVGVDLPDMKNIPLAIRVPPYREHLWYELKQLRRFWQMDMHQRDWRQVFVCSYFPNAIDPLLLTLLRLICCISVLVLECFASIQGYREVGKAQMLYFTNWNSLLVAAGFLSLSITSVIACISFAAPLQQTSKQSSAQQQQRQGRQTHIQDDGLTQQQQQQQQQQQHQQRLQRRSQLLMSPVEETASTYSLNNHLQHNSCTASRDSSSCSLGFSAYEFVAVDGRHPRPTYSSSKAAFLPWLVQQRQQLLQQKQQPRNTRALCLVLQGYTDLMSDGRYCVEGILLAPNPSNPSVPQSSPRTTCWSRRLPLFSRPKESSSSAENSSGSISNSGSSSPAASVPHHTLGAWASGAADDAAPSSNSSRVVDKGVAGSAAAVTAAGSAAATIATTVRGASTTVELPWFVKVTWVVHNLQLVASLGVAAVFFSLFKAEDVAFPGSWVTVWKHAVLVLLTLLHASLLSRIPCPMRHLGYTLVLFCCYLLLQVCVFVFNVPNGQGGVGYVYKVFHLSEPVKAAVVLLGIFLCSFLMHIFLWSISRKRCLYVDPPPSVSVTALQLKRSIRYAAAAAAAAAAAEQIAGESAAVSAASDVKSKSSLVRLQLQQQQKCCSDQASTGNTDGRQSGSSTRREPQQLDEPEGVVVQQS
ncbi:hypothetical protein, conserved [Eimeria necatrix]|uniref:Uncharacterized protein n=1 Tax=Eimeria necatrix TaxID=51315 RepID=U6MYD3_9EIME|nr:hypothetical protein, conserved [Eimeria necatrix]CDJ68018.1 hypothetical protein, conserved [Eimeria necatrix]